MKRFLALLATGALTLGLSSAASAQTQGLQGGALILHDPAAPSHQVILTVPSSPSAEYTAWSLVAPAGTFPTLTWVAPIPPQNGAQSGFIFTGPLTGVPPVLPSPNEMLAYWLMPGQAGIGAGANNGGSAGAWDYATVNQLGLVTTGGLSPNRVVMTDGTSQLSTPSAGTTTTVLHGNAAGQPTYGAVGLTTDVTGVLPIANGGTNGTAAPTAGAVSYGTGTAYAFNAAGTLGQTLHSAGAGVPTWSTVNLASATEVSGVLPIANGGTNSSTALTASAIAVSNGTQLVQGPQGTATTLLHGNAAGLPSYSAVSLTADVSGILPIANGGTNTSTAPNANAIVLGNAGGTAYSSMGSLGTTTTVLHGNAAGAPTFGAVSLTADVSGVLPVANGGTNSSTALANGKLMWSNGGQIIEAAGLGSTGSTITATGNIASTAGILNIGTDATSAGALTLHSATVGANKTGTLQLLAGATFNTANRIYSLPDASGVISLGGIVNGTVNNSTLRWDNASTTWVENANVLSTAAGNVTAIAGFNANSAGITNAGTITGGTGITSSGTINFSGLANGVVHATGGTGTLATSNVVLTSEVTGVLPVANGGTNSSTALTNNKIMVSNGGQIVEGTAGTTTTVLHGNAAGQPSYSAVSLTADVSGVLPIANGGTNTNTAPNANSIVLGNAGGTAYTSLGTTGSATTVLHGGAGAPTFGAVSLTADVSGVLPVANGGTNANSFTGNQIVVSNAAGTQLVSGGAGTTTTLLHGNAAGAPTYGAVVLTTDVSGILPIANGGTNANSFAGGNQFVVTNAGNTALASAALSTNATLTGTGIASALGINLANPNTWTGAQTFNNPASNAAPLVANNTFPNAAAQNALGATITSTGGGAGTNTALTLTASGAATNNALDVTLGNVHLTPLAASLPVKTDASKNLTAAAINLASAEVTGILPVANGGTNSSTALTNNKIMVSNGGQIVEGTAGTTTTVLHGNAAGQPSYSAVSLTADVSGVLPIANGGTNTNGAGNTAFGVLYYSGASDLTTAQGAANTLLHGNGAGVPTFSAVNLASADVTGILPVGNGGTGVNTLTIHGVVVGNAANPVNVTAAGAANTVLHGQGVGVDPSFAQVNLATGGDVTGVLPIANGGTNSGVALTGTKLIYSTGVGGSISENANVTVTAGGSITTNGNVTTQGVGGSNFIAGDATHAGKLKLNDGGGNVGTVQVAALTAAAKSYTIPDVPTSATGVFALLENAQTFSAHQQVFNAAGTSDSWAIDAENLYSTAGAANTSTAIRAVSNTVGAGTNKGISIITTGGAVDNIAVEVQSGRIVSTATAPNNVNAVDLLTTTSGTGAAIGIPNSNANGIVSSVTNQGIKSTTSSVTAGDFAVKGIATAAVAASVDGVYGSAPNYQAANGTTADGNVTGVAMTAASAPVIAEGDAASGINGFYSNGLVIKNGSFGVAGVQPAGSITGVDFSVSSNTVTVNNPLCTSNAYIIITPTNVGSAVAQLYVSSKANGSFVVTCASSGTAADSFDYFIITPVNR